jgi:hypothetical protein
VVQAIEGAESAGGLVAGVPVLVDRLEGGAKVPGARYIAPYYPGGLPRRRRNQAGVYEELRSAVAVRLLVENLWEIVRVSRTLLRSPRTPNPIIAFTIGAVCAQLALRYEGQAVSADYADLVGAYLLPAIERSLDLALGSSDDVCDAVNELARAYAETVSKS